MLGRSRRFRLIMSTLGVAIVFSTIALIGPSSALARNSAPGHDGLHSRIQAARAISIPYGILSATLLDEAILVTGHDGSSPPIVEAADAVEPGCPPGGHTVDIRVQVRDRTIPATLAKGSTTVSCSDATWEVMTQVHTPGDFVAGNDVWVCAHALVWSDPSAMPGKKGRIVGYRHWCKTVELE